MEGRSGAEDGDHGQAGWKWRPPPVVMRASSSHQLHATGCLLHGRRYSTGCGQSSHGSSGSLASSRAGTCDAMTLCSDRRVAPSSTTWRRVSTAQPPTGALHRYPWLQIAHTRHKPPRRQRERICLDWSANRYANSPWNHGNFTGDAPALLGLDREVNDGHTHPCSHGSLAHRRFESLVRPAAVGMGAERTRRAFFFSPQARLGHQSLLRRLAPHAEPFVRSR